MENKPSRFEWLVVFSFAVVTIGYYGAFLSFSVFLKPLIEEFGWTRAAPSGAMSVTTGLAGIISIITGKLADKYGARTIIGIGAFVGGIGYLFLSQITSLWEFYVFFGIFIGISMSTGWVPINATIARWFKEKRVLALGIATSGRCLDSYDGSSSLGVKRSCCNF